MAYIVLFQSAEVLLFQDELHDCGISQLNVKAVYIVLQSNTHPLQSTIPPSSKYNTPSSKYHPPIFKAPGILQLNIKAVYIHRLIFYTVPNLLFI